MVKLSRDPGSSFGKLPLFKYLECVVYIYRKYNIESKFMQGLKIAGAIKAIVNTKKSL